MQNGVHFTIVMMALDIQIATALGYDALTHFLKKCLQEFYWDIATLQIRTSHMHFIVPFVKIKRTKHQVHKL